MSMKHMKHTNHIQPCRSMCDVQSDKTKLGNENHSESTARTAAGDILSISQSIARCL